MIYKFALHYLDPNVSFKQTLQTSSSVITLHYNMNIKYIKMIKAMDQIS